MCHIDCLRKNRAPFFIVKSPCELDRLGGLLDAFPPAKAVWIVRHHHDGGNSAVRLFGNFAPQMKRQAQDKGSDAWRGRGMSDATQALLKRVAGLEPNELDGAAMMWHYRNVPFFERGPRQDSRVALPRFEDRGRQPPAKLGSLGRFLGLPGRSPWMTRHIHGASLRKSRPPALLPELEAACAGLMARFMELDPL